MIHTPSNRKENLPGMLKHGLCEQVRADEKKPWLDSWLKAQALFSSDVHVMPLPTWAVRGFSIDGDNAWKQLSRFVPEREGPISIYVHLPFCMTRCPFCDCYATLVPRKSREVVDHYLLRLQHETDQWSSLGMLSRRPVTTIHFGGGTPNALQPNEFERVVRVLFTRFAIDEQTELAIETTCRCLDELHTDQLTGLDFTRIHVGVQTLNPHLRSILGRHESIDTVLSRIKCCLQHGWIVSADMLYGLPGQTVDDLCQDLQRLVEVGIHGISLYRLNHGLHNHRFMVRHGLEERGIDHLFTDYCMFMEAADRLVSWGYMKNHFTHFALEKDRNLYSRHAIRNEDLLALGTTADGVFGDFYYRHVDLADYISASNEWPPLQGGGFFTTAEKRARGLVAQLMTGRVFDEGMDEIAKRFIRNIEGAGLIYPDTKSKSWVLANSGSWFAGSCVAEASRLYASSGSG